MMNKIGTVAAGIVVGACLSTTTPAADPEFRSAWVSRFEWPSTNANTARNNIRNIMRTLRENNFNAVLFQIRGQCDVLYPSPYEPWAPQFNWTNPGWDPLQFAIDEARANGLEFHAYINTHTIAQNVPPVNTTPQHQYNIHGPRGDSSWVIHDSEGQSVPYNDGYTWMSPGVPSAEAWTRMVVMDVVNRYDIDGVHFDRIRTPGPQYSYDPISVARFNHPDNPYTNWGDFMRASITQQLRRIYAEVMEVKPHIKMSAAPFGIVERVPGGYQGFGTQSRLQWYQDSFVWMQSGVLDCLMPQIYWDIGSAHPFEVLLADFLARDGDRHIYPGMVTSRDVIAQVYESRRQGALGHAVFSYNSLPWSAYRTGPFTEPAPIPDMPWKLNPTTGIILGTVSGLNGVELVDATVRRAGDAAPYLSGGDGLYAVLNLPPGSVQLTASKEGFRPHSQTVTIAAGEVKRVNFTLATFDASVMFAGDPVLVGQDATVVVSDGERVGDGTVNVTINREGNPGEYEATLHETENPGVFRGAFPIRMPGESEVQNPIFAEAGDRLVATYRDPQGGTAGATRVAQTNVSATHHIIDNDEPGFSFIGTWLTSSFGNNYGTNKRYIGPGTGNSTATWAFTGLPAGRYGINFWVNNNTYAREAAYRIDIPGAPVLNATGNQFNVGDGWQPLTNISAPTGAVTVVVSDSWTGGGTYVVADAMRLTFLHPMPETSLSSPDFWLIH